MNKRFSIIFAVSLLAVSCTEKINIKLDSTYTRLVVDGHIKSDTMAYFINLTKTSDYFSDAPAPRMVNATVSLSDGTNTFPLTETVPGQSGIYQTSSKFAGIIGKDYTLHISLPEVIAGTTDYTASCQLLGVTKLDSIQVIFNSSEGKDGVWDVDIFAQDPPGKKNYYMLNLYRNNQLWSDTINKVAVFDNQFFEGKYITGAQAFRINNSHLWETLYPGDNIMVELSAITQEYFNFISQVKEAGISIPFFTGPPANITGNVSNQGIGFFAAYSSSYARTVVN
jgi:hypothetical protein